MNKRNKLIIIGTLIVILIFFVFQIQIASSKESNQSLLNTIFAKLGDVPTSGAGGGAIPITTIELVDKGKDYNINPSRLKFEFNNESYAIQLRRVKQDVEEDYVEFIVMKLDKNNLDDVTAHTMDYSFKLVSGEKNEIDIDNDGTKDLFIKLKNIDKKRYESAQFFIKKIKVK